MVQGFQVRVLIADNDPFTLTLLTEALAAANFAVSGVPTVPDAISTIESFSPNVLVTDLNFGHGAPTGADLLAHVDEHHPWIGKVVLTSHISASLALPIGNQLTDSLTYLIKSQVSSISELVTAVKESITTHSTSTVPQERVGEQLCISKAQGEILFLIAEGYTNAAIATKRGASIRSTEALVQRTFTALGLGHDPNFNPRAKAVRAWQRGGIFVK